MCKRYLKKFIYVLISIILILNLCGCKESDKEQVSGVKYEDKIALSSNSADPSASSESAGTDSDSQVGIDDNNTEETDANSAVDDDSDEDGSAENVNTPSDSNSLISTANPHVTNNVSGSGDNYSSVSTGNSPSETGSTVSTSASALSTAKPTASSVVVATAKPSASAATAKPSGTTALAKPLASAATANPSSSAAQSTTVQTSATQSATAIETDPIASTYNLTVYVEVKNTGIVYISNSDGRTDIINGKYNAGAIVTICAEPNFGQDFGGWYIGDDFISSDKSYTFYMPACDYTISARFVVA